MFFKFPLIAVAMILLAGCGQSASTAALNTPSAGEFVNVRGGTFHWPPTAETATVLIFFGHDCPISNAYVPELTRLHQEYAPQGVSFCIVYADADLAEEAARKHAQEFGFDFPAILDPSMVLARQFGTTVKPEAAVVSPQRELLYLGRIDDTYFDFGKRRSQPVHRDLKEALDAVVNGRPVPAAFTQAVGCAIDFPAQKH